MLIIPLCAILFTAAVAQAQPLPKFEDFPAETTFTGKPVRPKLVRPEERQFRTVITRGVMEGDGVFETGAGTMRPGPNFAGQFIIVQWGCGTDCVQYAIVDAKTGIIYQPPVRGKQAFAFNAGMLTFRTNSRLILSDTHCNFLDGNGTCDRDYFVWDNLKFRHLRHVAGGGKQ